MRTPRILILILFLIACLFLLCRSITTVARSPPLVAANAATSAYRRPRVSSFFAFNSGFSLFSPNAAITLTDDNGTSFPAQPAAFGPNLPHSGLVGQLWIGSGFTDDALRNNGGDGELGCSDSPNWSDTTKRDIARPDTDGGSEARSVDSDTPERHYRSVDATGRLQRRRLGSIPDALETEAELFDRTSEIEGKIVLLSRGGCGFLEKVMWAQRRGATALIVGDNQKGGPLIQMFAKGDTSNVTIPSVFTARTTAHLLYSLTQPGSFIMETFDEKGRRALSVQQSHWSGAEDEPVEAIPLDRPLTTIPKSYVPPEGHQTTWWHKLFGRAAPAAPTTDDVQQDEMDQIRQAGLDLDPLMPELPEDESPPIHEGLWVTITPSDNGNPFFDTLLVLVVSPLITLTIVYAMLIIRARIRRRRWRAPKSVVEQLPVRTYHTVAPSPIHTPRAPSPVSPSPTTPLLQQPFSEDRSASWSRSRPGTAAGLSAQDALTPAAAAIPSSRPPPRPEHEKPAGSVPSEWKKYMGRQVECVVCLEEYVDGVSQVMSLPCGHEFHVECITPWLTTRRRTCPICKGDVVRSLARGGSSSPRYEPYRDDDESEDEGEASGSGSRDEDLEPGILSPTPRHRPTRAEAWLGRLSHSFGATSRPSESLPEHRGR